MKDLSELIERARRELSACEHNVAHLRSVEAAIKRELGRVTANLAEAIARRNEADTRFRAVVDVEKALQDAHEHDCDTCEQCNSAIV